MQQRRNVGWGFLAIAGAVFLLLSSVVVAQEDAGGTDEPWIDLFGSQQTAMQLLREAEEREDVWLAIAAARLLNETPGGIMLPRSEMGDGDTTNTVEPSESEGKSMARSVFDSAVGLAKRLAGDDERLNNEIDQIAQAEAKFYSFTCYTYNDLGARFYWTANNGRDARRNAIRACQANTPYGYDCYLSHCN